MRSTKFFGLAALAVAALTALPAAASAHPTVYATTGHLNGGKTNEVQLLTAATSGTYQPSAGAATIPFDAPAAVVEWALGKDTAIGVDATTRLPNVLVTATGPGTFALQFQGAKGKVDVPLVAPTGTGASIAQGTQGGTALTYPTAIPVDQAYARYVVASDGFASAATESNGLGDDHGWLNLAQNPGTYRAGETSDQWLTLGGTGLQTHATCLPVSAAATQLTALWTPANVEAVQNWKREMPGDALVQSFWNYVPWQSTSAGMDDEVSQWIPVVKSVTGIDLTGATPVQAAASCEGLGGAYVPADTAGAHVESALTTASVKAAVDPLTAQVASLTSQLGVLNAANATAATALTAAKAAIAAATTGRPTDVTLAAKSAAASAGVTTLVTGPAGAKATVTISVSTSVRKALGLKSATLAAAGATVNGQGALLVTVKPTRAAAKALARHKGSVAATVTTTIAGKADTAKVTLTH